MTKITEVSDQLVPLDQEKREGEMVLPTPSQPPLGSVSALGSVLGVGGHAGVDGPSPFQASFSTSSTTLVLVSS